jgi:hypothetical protein
VTAPEDSDHLRRVHATLGEDDEGVIEEIGRLAGERCSR